jgi:hypothetical protein
LKSRKRAEGKNRQRTGDERTEKTQKGGEGRKRMK